MDIEGDYGCEICANWVDSIHGVKSVHEVWSTDEVDAEWCLGKRQGCAGYSIGIEETIEGGDGGISGDVYVGDVVDDCLGVLVCGWVTNVVVIVVFGGGVQGTGAAFKVDDLVDLGIWSLDKEAEDVVELVG